MKTSQEFKQKGRRVGSAGGFFNQLMSCNASVPIVGEGATMLFHSDRDAYEVVEVNEAKKTCVIQKYKAKRIDGQGMSDSQTYEYKELYDNKIELVYRWGGWKRTGTQARFTDEAREKYNNNSRLLNEAYKEAGGQYDGAFIYEEIEGISKIHKVYSPVNIIFGVRREYYDYSF